MKTVVKTSGISIAGKRKVKVFLFILLLTSIIWLLIELSKITNSTAVFKIEYKNIPVGMLLQRKPTSEINIVLKAPGFSLLKYKIKKNKVALNLNKVVKGNSSYYLLPNQQKAYLNAQLPGETEVVSILKDTIFIELGKNKSKKVPVNLQLDIKFKLGYNLTAPLKIIPDSVTITGPEKYVDSIKELTNTLLELNDVHKNIYKELDLKLPPKNSNVILNTTKVIVKANVDKFTEGSFNIPVTIINKPEGIKINTFPNTIEVIYQAGLSNYNKITKNSFLIVYDYKQYEKDTLTRFLTPIIKQKSEFISSLKINPSQIEFLIQK
ncbi:YbbR-like domain-containing protein [Lutibacter sp.]|uniref:YbbR-like domain-containing protein n=1 Tax=Lutibacter sp. TaxID=1925666 RepID=UPI0025B87576|nr:YbbR-like domain-containing protein [Lutibacter sp.]MCF6167848.1 YbbR-like domain-containing protein [Lutibacter sp.]